MSQQEDSTQISEKQQQLPPTKNTTATEGSSSASPVSSHLEKALAHKQKGNDFVAKQEWKKASFEYKHIPLYLSQYVKKADGTGGEDPMVALAAGKNKKPAKPTSKEQEDMIRATLYAAYCNLSLVHLNLGRTSNALQTAQSAVDLIVIADDGDNSKSSNNNSNNNSSINICKAFYRRARARLACGLVEEAASDFSIVLNQNPDDAASKAGLAEVKKALAKAKEKEQKMCQKMFG